MLQAFLEANKLKLIIRSHEGPDARWKREGMQDMNKGHSLDHDTPGLSFHYLLCSMRARGPKNAAIVSYMTICFRLLVQSYVYVHE